MLSDVHKIRWHFLVQGEGEMAPLSVIFEILLVETDILSEDAFWLDTTVTRFEGKCKYP